MAILQCSIKDCVNYIFPLNSHFICAKLISTYYDKFITPMLSYGSNGSTKATPKMKPKFKKITYTNVKTNRKM
jgi:hypothetical protein